MTRLNPSSDVGALSPARPVAGVEAVASAAAPRGRMALLERLNGEKRGVDPKKLLDAVLLRRLGEDDYDKNEWNKLVPGVVERVRMRFGTFHELVGSDFETIRDHLVRNPGTGSRHLLNQLSRMKLLDAIGIDPVSFMNGAIRRSFLAAGFTWEQLHTNVGRAFASAFAAAAWGIDFIPEQHEVLVDGVTQEVVDKAAKLGKLAGQTMCSVLPTFVLTPLITGLGRSNTDVFENFALQYGFPALAPGLEKAAAMDPQILREAREQAQTCREAFQAIDWKKAYPKGVPEFHELAAPYRQAVEAMLGSAYKLYKVANTDYKLSMGSYKASAVGKAAGTVMNALGSGVTMLSFLKRYDLAFFYSLGLIVVQPVSGAQDKNAMATYYVDAGMKWDWQSLIEEPYRDLPPSALRPEHMAVSAGGKRWIGLEDVLVKAVKDVYKYQLSNLLADFDELLKHLAALREKRASSREIAEAERKLGSQCDELEGWRADIVRFNSRDPDEWKKISPRLGVYLDDTTGPLNKLKLGQREANANRPGEVLAQIMQRYMQLIEDLPLSFAVLYAAAKIMESQGVSSLVCEAILAVGAADYAVNTTQTRSDKANYKRVLARPLASADIQEADRRSARIPEGLILRAGSDEDGVVDSGEQQEATLHDRYALAGRWEYESEPDDDEATPLLSESGYRTAQPNLGERGRQLLQVARSGVLSGPRALVRLASTREQRRLVHNELNDIQRALEGAGFKRLPEEAPQGTGPTPGATFGKGTSMAATRARLEDYAVVTAYLLDQADQKRKALDAAVAAKAGQRDAAVPGPSEPSGV